MTDVQLPRAHCRVCHGRTLDTVLDLGSQPLANSFVSSAEAVPPEAHYPLELCRCRACGHIQLSVTVPPEVMFRDYIYVSGTSSTIPKHFADYARLVTERFLNGDRPLVVEVGSNDGTLLRAFPKTIRALGVEPALNIASIARREGIDTIPEFFDETLARQIAAERGPAQALIANNVVAHIDDLQGFARATASLLAPGGVLIAEFPYLQDLIDELAYDTIYHEHLSYFGIRAIQRLFEPVGLSVFDVERVPVHGGSLRVFVSSGRKEQQSVVDLAEQEQRGGLYEEEIYRDLARRVEHQRDELMRLLRDLRARGKRVAGYGAPAKGNTLLNYCGISTDLVEYLVDKSPLKQGKATPGTHIPVFAPDRLLQDRPDYALLLAWNFASEIVDQQRDYRAAGGRFIVPIPSPQVLS